MARRRTGALLVAAALALTGCGSAASDALGTKGTAAPTSGTPTRNSAAAKAFPAAGVFDYQIGGSYPPASGVRIVDRDRTSAPAPGRYNVCYVNAYQAQPGDLAWWQHTHPNLLLRDASGRLIIDRDWNEALLDIATPAKRLAIAAVVGGWFAGCAHSGYDAVEPDNLDSYTRSQGHLTQADAVAFAALLAGIAHRDTLLIGQKNAAELATRLRGSGYDFAVAEECQEYDECDAYTSAYGTKVIEIEYSADQFAQACAARRGRVSLLLRDRDVVAKGQSGYVSRIC
ncbi:endo alpha-1,4 polygalactosaminidase [Allobranchiibius huperziae]|uniref:Glycoside-hydrolase family GH114 TIM-barrel domain-containing protein n=1 Tax=Allobranchiibius huperziae TaxID=1874116 RepID=A0A853DIJ0_9MICO|nr:hypothetical protein [Allobranchiibius huperziae]